MDFAQTLEMESIRGDIRAVLAEALPAGWQGSGFLPMDTRPEHRELAQRLRASLAVYREGRDLVEIGAYRSGANPELDEAIALKPRIDAFLRQEPQELVDHEDTIAALRAIFAGAGA